MTKIKFVLIVLVCGIVFGLFVFLVKENKEVKEAVIPDEKNSYSELKIGYITDLHCYSKLDEDKNEWELNWRCSEPLANFIKMMNEEFYPDVIVDGGDLVDGRDKQEKNLYPVVFDYFKKFEVPAYHILGNHETRGFVKEDWLGFTGYEKTYYYQDIKDHRLIFLDGNNKPGVGDTTPEVRYYPGYLDTDQKEWLENVLKDSEGKNILIFVHQPPIEKTLLKDSSTLFIEGKGLREMFTKYKVSAVFSGHIEEMCYIEEGGVKYYVLEGTHKDNRQLLEKDDYKDKGVIYEIEIDSNGDPEVKMFYKDQDDTEYETLIVNSETAICNNQSIQNPEAYEALVDAEETQVEIN